MTEKRIMGRVVQKHDIEANWIKAINFVPLQSEIIVYDVEVDSDGNILELPEGRTVPYTYERIKIGDGKNVITSLPFVNDVITIDEINEICGSTVQFASLNSDEVVF